MPAVCFLRVFSAPAVPQRRHKQPVSSAFDLPLADQIDQPASMLATGSWKGFATALLLDKQRTLSNTPKVHDSAAG